MDRTTLHELMPAICFLELVGDLCSLGHVFPKLSTDAKQALCPNFNFAVFHRGEIVPLIPISIYPCSLPVTAQESRTRTTGLKHFPSPGKFQSTSDEVPRENRNSLIASLTLWTVEVSRNEGRRDNFGIATETDPVPRCR